MPPEFFLDRNLGRRVAEELRERGWLVHRIGEFFKADGQDVPDEEWIVYGLDRGWVPLSKDGRIVTRDHECRPLAECAGLLFYLNNQQLRSMEMVERFHAQQTSIHRAIVRGGPAAYVVWADRIERAWPRSPVRPEARA